LHAVHRKRANGVDRELLVVYFFCRHFRPLSKLRRGKCLRIRPATVLHLWKLPL
jgi:hypothetical protein